MEATRVKSVFVLGGTGPSGRETLLKCLEKGYTCYSMSRSGTPKNLPDDFIEKVYWKKGDVMNLEDLMINLKDIDAVISCIGTSGSLLKTNVYSKGLENIITAMEFNKINRLVFLSSAHDIPYIGCCFKYFTKKFILNKIYDDMIKAENMIKNYKGPILWLCVRPFEFVYNKTSEGKLRAVESHEITSGKGWIWKTIIEDIGIFNANEVFSHKYLDKFVYIGQ